MKPDITSRQHIEQLIEHFYVSVRKDETIGFIFEEVVKIHWEHHIPLIVDFWESILLDNPIYQKNAMEVHFDVNKKVPLEKLHFDAWLKLFNQAVDDLFEGKTALLAKTRAKSIGAIMLIKMDAINHH